jgi:hypothetical protein
MSRDYIGLDRMKQASHPLFIRFGTLGLFIFGYVKGKLMGYRVETPSERFVRIQVILTEVPRETLNAVFSNEWMERLQNCVQVNGEYVG